MYIFGTRRFDTHRVCLLGTAGFRTEEDFLFISSNEVMLCYWHLLANLVACLTGAQTTATIGQQRTSNQRRKQKLSNQATRCDICCLLPRKRAVMKVSPTPGPTAVRVHNSTGVQSFCLTAFHTTQY